MVDVILLPDGLPLGTRIKRARMARELRQGDVAYLATEWAKAQGWSTRIQTEQVSFLERGFATKSHQKQAILAVLGLLE
jgi:hypothetical protein